MNLDLLLYISGSIFCFVTALFLLSLYVKRNDIADIAWGPGIFLVALLSFVSTPLKTEFSYLLLILAAAWGIRLGVRIFLRNIRKSEDPRYAVWRISWGKWFYLRSYAQVYLLQGFLMVVVGYAFIHASVFAVGAEVGFFTFLGCVVWSVGYVFEVVGDYQLDAFLKSKPEKGSILTTGLWKYSRHPNYFGEVTMWWGIWLMLVPFPFAYIALLTPLSITFLILKVSGIPMLEKSFEYNPQFQIYKAKTSAFFPLPPRS